MMQKKRKMMIVTGARQGIGAGVTNAFIERGYNVVADSLNMTISTFPATDLLGVVRGDIAITRSLAMEYAKDRIRSTPSLTQGATRPLSHQISRKG